jgi:hypothetical protein
MHIPPTFIPNLIYEFKIDFYQTNTFSGDGFFDYGIVTALEEKNKFRVDSYYFNKDEKKFKPCVTTRNDTGGSIITFDKYGTDCIIFHGPQFTKGYRKGEFDYWIMDYKDSKLVTYEI